MKKILLVDDEITFINLFKKKYENKYKIINATNADEGVEVFKKEKPDLVLMDLFLYDKDGIYCLKEILKLDKHAKVIMFTCLLGSALEEKCLKAGAIDYLQKEFNEHLNYRIEKALEEK